MVIFGRNPLDFHPYKDVILDRSIIRYAWAKFCLAKSSEHPRMIAFKNSCSRVPWNIYVLAK
jgi:hypothetical protein